MRTDLKYEKENIELRRGKVLELLAHGLRHKEIAEKLNVSPALISIDIQFIRERSKKDLQTHFRDQLPYEYSRSMAGINATLRRAADLLEEAKDPKTKIECMKLQMELWKSVMSMATDGGILQRAIQVIEGIESNVKSEEQKDETLTSKFDAKVEETTEEAEAEAEEEPTEQEE